MDDDVCLSCGAEVASYLENLRLGRLFLLMIAGSILGAMIAFTGAMFYAGIADTQRLVIGAWGFTALALLGLIWLREQLKADLNLGPRAQKEGNSNGHIDQPDI